MNPPINATMLSLLAVLFGAGTFLSADTTRPASVPYRTSSSGAGGSFSPVFSGDGRFVAFVSHANNLVTNDDLEPRLDLFVRDLVTSNTVLVSVSSNGFGGANDDVTLCSLSSNAQIIVFETAANNLATGDTNRGSDIYVRNTIAGTTALVSLNVAGTATGNGTSHSPLISADGRHVIFESLASNLVTNDFNGTNDIFIRDLLTGVTLLVSVNAEGTASPAGPSYSPSISANGLFVAFASRATNLVIGVTNLLDEIYVRDIAGNRNLWAMASHLPGTHSRSASGALEPYHASEPVLSADGRYVAFKTRGQVARFDLQRPTNSIYLEFTSDPLSYFRFNDNPRLGVSSGETPLVFTPDGRYAAYTTTSNVVPSRGIVLVDFETLQTNVFQNNFGQTNVTSSGQIVVTNLTSSSGATWTELPWVGVTADASRLCFMANATNLISIATNRTLQLYGLDLPDGPVQLLSTNRDGKVGPDLGGASATLHQDGSLIAWDSPDDHIVTDDLNRSWDVFIHELDSGDAGLVSARHPGLTATSAIAMSRLDPTPTTISANGQRIAVVSVDNTITPDDTNTWRDLFVHDLTAGVSFEVSASTVLSSPGGVGNVPGSHTVSAPSLSADGRYVAYSGMLFDQRFFTTNHILYWRDLLVSSNRIVTSGREVSHQVLSADGQMVAFASTDAVDSGGIQDLNARHDVFLYRPAFQFPPFTIDCAPTSSFRANPLAVSTTPLGNRTANGASINPAFSPDGSRILFQSLASDIVDGLPGSPSAHQLYARAIGTANLWLVPCQEAAEVPVLGPTVLLSYATVASSAPDGRSAEIPLPGGGANPRFSANSRYVVFESEPDAIYRHNLLEGPVTTVTAQGGVRATNYARLTNALVCTTCANPSVSGDGRFVVFETQPATGNITNVSVKDLESGQEDLISVSLAGGAGGNASSFNPLLSYDARHVVFASKASDLVLNDTNRATDIFVRDRLAGVTHCLSRNFAGTATGNRVSSNPVLSADGRTVAFQSFASDLVPGDYNDTRDVFVVTLTGPDSDGDGLDDDWEMAYFSTLSRDGTGDFDHDGASDRDEFRAGTNPANDASILRVLTLTTAPDQSTPGQRTTVLLWSAVPGRTYQVQFKSDVAAPWTELGGTVFSSNTTATQTHVTTSNEGRAFYRVLLVQ